MSRVLSNSVRLKQSKAKTPITIEQLSNLFQSDRIRQNASNETLLSWGKYDGLCAALSVNPKRGISNDPSRLRDRRRKYGSNNPVLRKVTTLWQFIVDTFDDPMLRVLCVAAVTSLVLGVIAEGLENGWMEGTSILVAIGLIVSVTSINNYLKERQFDKLNTLAKKKRVSVLRDGYVFNIDMYDLLVGDIVKIETGEITSCDGVLTQCNQLSVDESAMTGESVSIRKSIPSLYTKEEAANPWIISGSRVLHGTGEMMILAVGPNSQYGKIRAKLSMQEDATPLQQKLEILGVNIGHIGTFAALMTFLALMMHLIWEIVMSDHKMQYLSMQTIRIIVEYFIVAVSIIVVAVPEGLPLAVTISLAYSIGKMKDQNNLVRYLSACETMGGVNNICTDKTGTLTMSAMQVIKIFTNNKIYDAKQNIHSMPKNFKERFSKNCCMNSNAYPGIDKKGKFQMIGSKTECALLQQSYKFGFDYRKIRNKQGTTVLKFFPFSSDSKKMAVLYNESGRIILSVKGAPETTINFCENYLTEEGPIKIDDQFKLNVQKVLDIFTRDSLRTLLIAQKDFRALNSNETLDTILNGMNLVGIVGIRDPLRPEIKQSIRKCKSAGVTVRMLTGDNEQTSVAIAKQSGILDKTWARNQPDKQYAVMQGKDFRAFVGGVKLDPQGKEIVRNIDNFRIVEQQLRVLARSTPEDKYIMAVGLKQLEGVVAMTGDGTNDAPALKKADIGLAMGITGTEVAKDAADIILLDDNFASIVTAIKWGRNILESIRKFLQFQLTVNAVALCVAFLGSVLTQQSPLKPIQMLWVNLIMDTFAALALATDSPKQELLDRKPYSRFQSLITPEMWKNIIFQAGFQLIVLGFILFCIPTILNIPTSIDIRFSQWNYQTGKHYTIFFNVFVLLQLFNEVNCRKLHNTELNVFENFFENKLFTLIFVVTLYVHYKLMFQGGKAVKVVPLTWFQHALCVALGSLSLLFGYLTKKIGPSGINIKMFVDELPTIKKRE